MNLPDILGGLATGLAGGVFSGFLGVTSSEGHARATLSRRLHTIANMKNPLLREAGSNRFSATRD